MWPWRIATAWPQCFATTSAVPADSTSGDLMNPRGKGFPSRPAKSTAASKLSTCRPYPLRRTEMSSRPRPLWPAIPSVTSRASTIMPAHVASVGRPPAMALRKGSSTPTRSISVVIVVLSPPGRTRPARSPRSSRARRRGDATRGEVHDRQAAETLTLGKQLDRRADLLGFAHELGVAQTVKLPNPGVDGTGMSNGFDHVPGPGLTFGANHGRTFGDSSQRLTKVATAADERNLERVLVDMVLLVGGREHLGLVDVVNPKGLEDLRLDEVADPALGHDRDVHRLPDRADQRRIGHPRHP